MADHQDIDVLREMVRLAENRRAEAMDMIERVNKYNLAIIAFDGSFLSLLISLHQNIFSLRIAGLCLIISILVSLLALRPRVLRGGSISIDVDIAQLRSGESIQLQEYLLDVADFTDQAAKVAGTLSREKKLYTILSASLLALSLIITYILYSYA